MSIPHRFLPLAAEVRDLREASGAGMMECKRILVLKKLEPAIAGVEDPIVRDILATLLLMAKHEL